MIPSPLKKTVFLACSIVSLALAGPSQGVEVPDLTQDGRVPERSPDWTLGATGVRGWMFTHRLETSRARQIAVTQVAKGSPADGVLEVGDVILGVGDEAFSSDPRTEFGQALTAAESTAGAGELKLIRWRKGETAEATIKLPVLGDYSATAPFDCEKSARILQLGSQALAARMAQDGYGRGLNPIPRALNALALLATGEEEFLPLVRREAEWAANFSTSGFQTWYYAYLIMLLAEYEILTGDSQFKDGMKRLALEASEGQSIVGSWGHKFAGEDGRLVGYGMMNAPGVPLTIALIMAREAGLDDPVVDQAIERSARLIRFYIGKGAIPYGDHHPWTQTHEDNGKSGMAAVMFNLLGEREGAEFFNRMAVAAHNAERDGGHTGNYTNILWAMPAVALAGPQATGAWMNEFGAWYFDLARQWDGNFQHQSQPSDKRDKFSGWDATGAYLLAYAMAKRNLILTGKNGSITTQLDAAGAEALLADGRGWSNDNRTAFYDSLKTEELFDRLASWSPTVRERAASALQRRQRDIDAVPTLIAMLDSPDETARYGACEALKALRGGAAAAVPKLAEQLAHEDMWVRVVAADALAHIGQPAMPTLPVLLERLAQPPSADDPRNMEQRYLCFAVFGQMLKNSLDDVDRGLLKQAIVAGLQNQDGRARGSVGQVYRHLTFEEVAPLLPFVLDAIVEPAPSGIMFANGVRLSGLELLAKHRIAEGMELCFEVLEIDAWGKRDRIKRCLDILGMYGGSARAVLPQLHQLEQDLMNHSEARGLAPLIEQVRSLIQKIENAEDTIELRTLG